MRRFLWASPLFYVHCRNVRCVFAGSILTFLTLFLALPAGAEKPMLGFSAEKAAAQRQLEAAFDTYLDAEDLEEWMRYMTQRPHHVGSEQGRANAEYMRDLFASFGFDARIETFGVLFPTPKERVLEMIAPERITLSLEEPPVPGDKSSASHRDEHLPTYNAYSLDGDVTAELVYVNYGLREDYEELALRGIDVRGKIVIARYGGSWRGIKPKVAAENGAIGCILFSDPAADGYRAGDVYPKGGFRSEHSVQRGSVKDFSVHSGDPSTPFVGSVEGVERVPQDELEGLAIPTLPISAADAQPLLAALGGPVAPAHWHGDLPLTYHLGPGPTKVRLKVSFNWDITPAHNIIAVLEGSEFPDQWILRGNHHDGWGYGATDPVSGMVAVLAEAKAMGELVKTGWRPRRTLIYAGWDAEEPGLLGSIEWAETHTEELSKKAVAYLNTDSNTRGFLNLGGSHMLEKFVNQVAREVTDPQTGISAHERTQAAMRYFNYGQVNGNEIRLRPLGSGSDFTPFIQYLGIASLNVSYGGEEEYGQYHSLYDTFEHFSRFGDPGYAYGVALAQTNGRLVMRLANADILPFDFAAFADVAGAYVEELVALPDELRKRARRKNAMIDGGVFEAALDPTKKWIIPEREEEIPHLNFAPLQNAVTTLQKSVALYSQARTAVVSGTRTLTKEEQLNLNRILMLAERSLTREEGLPGRPWYRHQVYAPGVYTGYAPKTMPGIREAIEDRRFEEAEEQIRIMAEVLGALTQEVDRATSILAP